MSNQFYIQLHTMLSFPDYHHFTNNVTGQTYTIYNKHKKCHEGTLVSNVPFISRMHWKKKTAFLQNFQWYGFSLFLSSSFPFFLSCFVLMSFLLVIPAVMIQCVFNYHVLLYTESCFKHFYVYWWLILTKDWYVLVIFFKFRDFRNSSHIIFMTDISQSKSILIKPHGSTIDSRLTLIKWP